MTEREESLESSVPASSVRASSDGESPEVFVPPHDLSGARAEGSASGQPPSPSETPFWKRKLRAQAWEVGKILALSILIVAPLRYFVVQPFIVRGDSMKPNFENAEYLIIDELSYFFRAPERGEVIVFRYPRNPRQYFIKRIVGLPGEVVSIEGGKTSVKNAEYPEGWELEESYLDPPGRLTYPDTTWQLGDNEYFVLGDNRDFSSDSRLWGALERRFITGRTFWRVWPLSRFGSVTDVHAKSLRSTNTYESTK